jgi:hypothetical protein
MSLIMENLDDLVAAAWRRIEGHADTAGCARRLALAATSRGHPRRNAPVRLVHLSLATRSRCAIIPGGHSHGGRASSSAARGTPCRQPAIPTQRLAIRTGATSLWIPKPGWHSHEDPENPLPTPPIPRSYRSHQVSLGIQSSPQSQAVRNRIPNPYAQLGILGQLDAATPVPVFISRRGNPVSAPQHPARSQSHLPPRPMNH